MSNTPRIEAHSATFGLMADCETFDGACDPGFDSDLDELERQFAEFRTALASELI
jgi:hypothetical protein